MRRASLNDIPHLKNIYKESYRHAFRVGHIDWPEKFSEGFFRNLIKLRELYVFELNNQIVASVKLAKFDNPLVWPIQSKPFLYIGKMATSEKVRGMNFIAKQGIPSMKKEGIIKGKIGFRLNCLADNSGLINYYNSLGFADKGQVNIYSELSERNIEIRKFEMVFY